MVSYKAINIDKPKNITRIRKEEIPLEDIDYDYSEVMTFAEFFEARDVEERKWAIKEFQDEYGDLYNALALTNGTLTKNGKRGYTCFVLCKELQEEGYVLDKDFVKDNKRDIMLMAPEDINSKYDSDYKFGIIYFDSGDWDDWK